MSNSLANQRRSGYVLVAGGIAVLLGGVAYFVYHGAPFPSHLGPVIPSVILIALGYRNISATRDNKVVTDERRKQLVTEAGNTAFWIFLSVIVLDAFLQISPDDGVRTVYMAVAIGAFGLGLVLAKFTNFPSTEHGQ